MDIKELRKVYKEKKNKYLLNFTYTDIVNETFYTDNVVIALKKYDDMINSADLLESKISFPQHCDLQVEEDHIIVSNGQESKIIMFGINADLIIPRVIIDPLIIMEYYSKDEEDYEYPYRTWYISGKSYDILEEQRAMKKYIEGVKNL